MVDGIRVDLKCSSDAFDHGIGFCFFDQFRSARIFVCFQVYSLIQMVVGAIPLTADTDYMKSAPALGLATIVVAVIERS